MFGTTKPTLKSRGRLGMLGVRGNYEGYGGDSSTNVCDCHFKKFTFKGVIRFCVCLYCVITRCDFKPSPYIFTVTTTTTTTTTTTGVRRLGLYVLLLLLLLLSAIIIKTTLIFMILATTMFASSSLLLKPAFG